MKLVPAIHLLLRKNDRIIHENYIIEGDIYEVNNGENL